MVDVILVVPDELEVPAPNNLLFIRKMQYNGKKKP